MYLTLVLLTSASHNHINSDKAASGKRSKPLPRIVVALLQSIFNTVARRSYSHPSQTSTTTPSQSSSGFLPHSRWKSQLSPLLAMSYTVCTLLWFYNSPILILIHSPVAELPLLQHACNTFISGPLTCYFLCFSPERSPSSQSNLYSNAPLPRHSLTILLKSATPLLRFIIHQDMYHYWTYYVFAWIILFIVSSPWTLYAPWHGHSSLLWAMLYYEDQRTNRHLKGSQNTFIKWLDT